MALPPIFTSRLTQSYEAQANRLARDASVMKDPLYQEHFSKSQSEIIAAIQGMQGRAIILGAGPANDLPLERLALTFDCVTLVDMDFTQTYPAVGKLPQLLQNKFRFEKADLTGLLPELSEKVEALLNEKLPYEAFVSKVTELLPNLKKRTFEYQNQKVSFVCSSLVCSQLASNVISYLSSLTQETYKKSFEMPIEAYHNFEAQIELSHVKELRQLMDSKGMLYFADHFSAKTIVSASSVVEEKWLLMHEETFKNSKLVTELIETTFVAIDENFWYWYLPMKKKTGDAQLIDKENIIKTIKVNYVEYSAYLVSTFRLKART